MPWASRSVRVIMAYVICIWEGHKQAQMKAQYKLILKGFFFRCPIMGEWKKAHPLENVEFIMNINVDSTMPQVLCNFHSYVYLWCNIYNLYYWFFIIYTM